MMWRTSNDDREDWGDSFDDGDSEYWNDLYSGPDDDEIEEFDNKEQITDDDYGDSSELEENEVDNEWLASMEWITQYYEYVDPILRYPIEVNESFRTNKIIKWLESSEISKIRPNNFGFFVPKGLVVKLEGGIKIEIIDWLEKEGISEGIAYDNYSIVRHFSNDYELLGYNFYKIVDAPFRAK